MIPAVQADFMTARGQGLQQPWTGSGFKTRNKTCGAYAITFKKVKQIENALSQAIAALLQLIQTLDARGAAAPYLGAFGIHINSERKGRMAAAGPDVTFHQTFLYGLSNWTGRRIRVKACQYGSLFRREPEIGVDKTATARASLPDRRPVCLLHCLRRPEASPR